MEDQILNEGGERRKGNYYTTKQAKEILEKNGITISMSKLGTWCKYGYVAHKRKPNVMGNRERYMISESEIERLIKLLAEKEEE